MKPFFFHVTVDTDDSTGQVLAAYFRIRKGKVNKTVEFAKGNVFADYDRRGQLIGIELLGPCNVAIVDKLAPDEPAEARRCTKRFLREAGPAAMVAA